MANAVPGKALVHHAGHTIKLLEYREAASLPGLLIAIATIHPAVSGDTRDWILGFGDSEEACWQDAVEHGKSYITANLSRPRP